MGDASTIIGPGVRISGRLEGAEDVQVFGSVQGQISLPDSALLVEKEGVIQAEVEAAIVEVRGALVGKVTAKDCVELFSEARVIGDLYAPRVIVHGGALFKGRVEVEGTDPEGERPASPSRAAPKGRTTPASTPAAATPSSRTPTRAGRATPTTTRSRTTARPEPQPEPEVALEPEPPLPPDGVEEKAVAVKPKG